MLNLKLDESKLSDIRFEIIYMIFFIDFKVFVHTCCDIVFCLSHSLEYFDIHTRETFHFLVGGIAMLV